MFSVITGSTDMSFSTWLVYTSDGVSMIHYIDFGNENDKFWISFIELGVIISRGTYLTEYENGIEIKMELINETNYSAVSTWDYVLPNNEWIRTEPNDRLIMIRISQSMDDALGICKEGSHWHLIEDGLIKAHVRLIYENKKAKVTEIATGQESTYLWVSGNYVLNITINETQHMFKWLRDKGATSYLVLTLISPYERILTTLHMFGCQYPGNSPGNCSTEIFGRYNRPAQMLQ